MNGINPLNPLFGQIEKFEESHAQASKWESSRVEWTMRRLKLGDERKQMMHESGYAGNYTYEAFIRTVPSFPMDIVAEPRRDELPLHRDAKAVHPMWFKSFRSLSFVSVYEERFGESSREERPFGMVFPRKGFLQGLILHNGDWDLFIPPQSSCHLFKGGKKRSMNLIVQPYQGFIDHVYKGLSWRP
jgi:hypothetical protein|tara:strand:+ start:316 stop:876 length:561 start_codon:yes stop_codon:yes gene_type:complete